MTDHDERPSEPTLADLLDRIDALENKLAPEPPPTLNGLLRKQASDKRAENTLTDCLDDPTRKEGA